MRNRKKTVNAVSRRISISKNNRGSVEDSLRPLIGTMIALLLIIFVILPLGMMLYGIFFDKEGQGTRESLKSIDNAIRNSQSGVPIEVSIYIKNGVMLVGFNANDNTVEETCSAWGTDTIRKPTVCGTSGCLCLCDEGGCDIPLKCIVYKMAGEETEEILPEAGEDKEIICFTGSDEKPNFGADSSCDSGKDLVIYGNCNWAFQSDEVYTAKIINSNDKNIAIEII